MRQRVLDLAHEGHQGVVRTKQRLRSKVWWPGMSIDVEKHIQHCHPCQVVGPAQTPTPLQMTPIPKAAWLLVGADLCGPFPTGEHLLVCVDYYSRYPEVEIIHKISSQAIITKLRKLFCRYGAPQELITDNGPQFVSKELKLLLSEFGTKHRLVTPYHPEANGEVERFNRCLKKCIQTAVANGRNWRIDLETFLLNYRNTQHATTKETPAKLMFGRNLRDKLPLGTVATKVSSSLAKIDNTNKLKGKAHADKVRKAQPTNIKSGDRVLITNTFKHRNKLSSRWQPQPLTVTQVKGNAIFMQRDGKTLMRSAGQVKLYYTSPSAIQPRPRLSERSTSDSSVDSHETAPQLQPQDEVTAEPDTTDSDQSTEEQHITSDQRHSSDTTAPYNLDADDESSDNESITPPNEHRVRRVPRKFKDYILT